MSVERTLTILKPDCVKKGLIGEVTKRIQEAGFRIVAMKMMQHFHTPIPAKKGKPTASRHWTATAFDTYHKKNSAATRAKLISLGMEPSYKTIRDLLYSSLTKFDISQKREWHEGHRY